VIRAEIRSWLHLRSDQSIEDLSRMYNPIIRGWLQYYGRFYRSALYPPAATGSIAGPVGLSEIQEAEWSFAWGNTLGRALFATIRNCGRTGRWVCGEAHGGSRMS